MPSLEPKQRPRQTHVWLMLMLSKILLPLALCPEEGQTGSLDEVPDDLMDGDVDDYVRLEAGYVRSKARHPLSGDARAKAMPFFR